MFHPPPQSHQSHLPQLIPALKLSPQSYNSVSLEIWHSVYLLLHEYAHFSKQNEETEGQR